MARRRLPRNDATVLNSQVLLDGEVAWDTTNKKLKLGDGSTTGGKSAAYSEDLAASGGSSAIGFLQAGTGAVARTVQAKMRDVVNAADFGAVADDSTDNTALIQAALTAHKNVIINGAGTYRITDALVLQTGQTVTLSPGTTIRQMTTNKQAFIATTKNNVVINLNGGTVYGAGGWSAAWTGNQGQEGFRGIHFVGCNDFAVIGPGRVYNFANAGISIVGGTRWLIDDGIRIEGTTGYTQTIPADGNFQNGIYICNDATHGRGDAGLIINPNISGTAQGILRELPTATNQPATMTHIIGGKIHDIPGQHGFYNQASKLTAVGTAFERCHTSAFKTQSADINADLQDVNAVGIIAEDCEGGSLFEIATTGTGSINNSRFQGVGRNVGYLASLNNKMNGVTVEVAGDIAANGIQLIGTAINATIRAKASNVKGVGVICTATGSDVTFDQLELLQVNTDNTGPGAFGVLGTYLTADDPSGPTTTLRLRSPKITSPNGYMVNNIRVGRTKTTIIVEGDATFANATASAQFVDTLGTIVSSYQRSWTPTFTASSGTLTTVNAVTATYWQTGNVTKFELNFTIADAGTATGVLYATLPVNTTIKTVFSGIVDSAAVPLQAYTQPSNLTRMQMVDVTGSNAIATGRTYIVSGEYQWAA
jgi:hypothetical protein